MSRHPFTQEAAEQQRRASLVGNAAKWRITNLKQVAQAIAKWPEARRLAGFAGASQTGQTNRLITNLDGCALNGDSEITLHFAVVRSYLTALHLLGFPS